jgi:hypothetical protein
MKKSFCYRACRDKEKGISFVKTPSYLEVVTDRDGNKFNIHIHRVGDEWSATEESTGLRCVPAPGTFPTRNECHDVVMRVKDRYAYLLSLGDAPKYKRELMLYKKSLEGEG